MRFDPFEPSHVVGAKVHRSQARYQFMLDRPGLFRRLWPQTYSALDGAELVAIGGTLCFEDVWSGWVVFTDRITPARFLAVHRLAVRFVVSFEQIRHPIIVHFDRSNPASACWVGLLGLDTGRTDVLLDGSRMLRAGSESEVYQWRN